MSNDDVWDIYIRRALPMLCVLILVFLLLYFFLFGFFAFRGAMGLAVAIVHSLISSGECYLLWRCADACTESLSNGLASAKKSWYSCCGTLFVVFSASTCMFVLSLLVTDLSSGFRFTRVRRALFCWGLSAQFDVRFCTLQLQLDLCRRLIASFFSLPRLLLMLRSAYAVFHSLTACSCIETASLLLVFIFASLEGFILN